MTPPSDPAPDPTPPPRPSLRARVSRHPLLTAWLALGVVLLASSLWALDYAARWQPDGTMTATVWRGADGTGGAPVRTVTTTRFDPERLAVEAGLSPREPFVVEWRGWLVAEEGGTHRLRVRMDDGVGLWVNEAPIIDEVEHRGYAEVMGQTFLAPGLHRFRLRYVQHGGEALLRVSWALPSYREEFVGLLLAADSDPPPLLRRIQKARAYPLRVAVWWSAWIVAGLGLGGAWLLAHLAGRRLAHLIGWRPLVILGLVTGPLLALSLDVGVHPWRGWGPDEIKPTDALVAVNQRFGGGWFHIYPPLQFYVLALVNAPLMLLESRGVIDYADPRVFQALHTVDRAASLMLAWLTLLATAVLAWRVATPRTRLLAPYVLAGIPLFGFYARTTNTDMPYTFWVTAAALALWNAMRERQAREYAWLGALAAAAMASKDQAYGYFPGAALLLLWLSWRDTGGAPWAARLGRTLSDRRLWMGLVTCLGLYALLIGILWNPEGVRAHFALITGPASAPFRMFPFTPAGIAELTFTTLWLLGQAIGPLVLAAATLGLGVAVSSSAQAAGLVGPAAMVLGYGLTFVAVVGYVYDRFLIAALPLVALVAARGLAWAIERLPSPGARTMGTVVAAAACLVPGALLTARQLTDTRFGVERWMQEQLVNDPLVLGVGTALYLPNLYPFQHRLVPSASVPELLEWNPGVVVLNGDWFDRPGQPPGSMVRHDLAEAGFEPVHVVERTPAGGRWWPLVGSGLHIDPLYSNIGKLSPPLAIWMRRPPSAAPTARLPLATTPAPEVAGTIVFQSNREGRDKLYRLDLGTRTVTALTSGAAHRDEDPAVSPDGRRVAFTTTRFDASTYDIAVLDLASGVVRPVTTGAPHERQPAWSPDGQTLYFTSSADGTDAIHRAGADGEGSSRVSPPPDRALFPDIAPDGRLACTIGTADGLRIAIADERGVAPRLVSALPGDAVRPRWSPDGRRLAYTRLTPSRTFIEVLDVETGTAHDVGVDGLAQLDDPAWSPDGRWLVVSGAVSADPKIGGRDLYLLRLGESAAAWPLTSGRGDDRAPAWGPR